MKYLIFLLFLCSCTYEGTITNKEYKPPYSYPCNQVMNMGKSVVVIPSTCIEPEHYVIYVSRLRPHSRKLITRPVNVSKSDWYRYCLGDTYSH